MNDFRVKKICSINFFVLKTVQFVHLFCLNSIQFDLFSLCLVYIILTSNLTPTQKCTQLTPLSRRLILLTFLYISMSHDIHMVTLNAHTCRNTSVTRVILKVYWKKVVFVVRFLCHIFRT